MNDYRNVRFNQLVGIEFDHMDKHRRSFWKWQCDCGNTVIARADCVKDGNTKSCGCMVHNKKPTKHGHSHDKLYHVFHGMKQRCYNPNSNGYEYYGKRGIKIADEWLEDYEAFHKWAIDNGYRESLSIERIDVNGNYEPGNCKWVTQKEQTMNTRRNTYITINGVTKHLCEWCEYYNVNMSTACHRIKRGLPFEKVFNISK